MMDKIEIKNQENDKDKKNSNKKNEDLIIIKWNEILMDEIEKQLKLKMH
jgi:hypothetical protein